MMVYNASTIRLFALESGGGESAVEICDRHIDVSSRLRILREEGCLCAYGTMIAIGSIADAA